MENEDVKITTPADDTNDKLSADTEINSTGGRVRKPFPKVPVWTLILCVVLAAAITFMTAYTVLNDRYKTALNNFEANRSSVSREAGKIYRLLDEINALYETDYINELDYKEMVDKVLKSYMETTGDKYAYYYTAEEWEKESNTSNGNSVGIGIYTIAKFIAQDSNIIEYLTVLYAMDGSPAKYAGLKTGDMITAIDGVPINGMDYDDAVEKIRGKKGEKVTLTVISDDVEKDVDIVRATYTVQTVKSQKLGADKKIGYILITEFYQVTIAQFKYAVDSLIDDGCTGLIIDLRDNPGGYLNVVTDMLDYLLPEGPIVKIEYSDKTSSTIQSDSRCIEKMPIVILTNSGTASASELFTKAMKDYGYAISLGTVTYGKGCGQTVYPISNGGCVKLTTFLYYAAYSDNFDGIGIEPDIEVEINEKYKETNTFLIPESEDNQLQAAIEYISKNIK